MTRELTYKNKNKYSDVNKYNFVLKGFSQPSNHIIRELAVDYHVNVAFVYIIILSHRNTDNNQCFPSKELLVKETGLNISTIKKCIKTLGDNGYLVWKKGNSKFANNYYFPMEPFYKGEGNYLLNKIIKQVEEIPTQDNNISVSVGESFDFEVSTDDNKTFKPIGKYSEMKEDDLLEKHIEDIPVKYNNISVGYLEKFYANMHNYYNVDDNSLKTNKTINTKLNNLTNFIKEELAKNNIDLPVEKIIDESMKTNKKSFTKALVKITGNFNKCIYIISCIQNNFKDKKLQTLIKNKVNSFTDITDEDDSDESDYIILSDNTMLTKNEAIDKIKWYIKDEMPDFKFLINKNTFDILKRHNIKKIDECNIQILKKIIKSLNKFYGREILLEKITANERRINEYRNNQNFFNNQSYNQ